MNSLQEEVTRIIESIKRQVTIRLSPKHKARRDLFYDLDEIRAENPTRMMRINAAFR